MCTRLFGNGVDMSDMGSVDLDTVDKWNLDIVQNQCQILKPKMFSCQKIANVKACGILHISTVLVGLQTMH